MEDDTSMSAAVRLAEREHLLQALQNDTEFRTAVRNILLSEELLALPERFAKFTDYVLQHIQEQETFNARFDQLIARIDSFIEKQEARNAQFDGFIARFEDFIEKQEARNAQFDGFIARFEDFIEKQEARNAQFDGFIVRFEDFIEKQEARNAQFDGFIARFEDFIEKQEARNAQFDRFIARFEDFIEKQEARNAQFDGFIARFEDFMEKQEVHNARFEDFMEKQEARNAQFDRFIARFEDFIEKQEARNTQFEKSIERIDRSIERIDRSIIQINRSIERIDRSIEEQKIINKRTDATLAILKGNATRMLLRDHHETILEMLQLDFVRTLGRDDLTRMVRKSGRADQIPFGERRSFYAADLVLEATDTHGNTHYVAAEASFTADRRDTERAQRNAAYITEFTGQPTLAIVASIANDRDVQDLVESGAIPWFQLDERELQPD